MSELVKTVTSYTDLHGDFFIASTQHLPYVGHFFKHRARRPLEQWGGAVGMSLGAGQTADLVGAGWRACGRATRCRGGRESMYIGRLGALLLWLFLA
jgi:hypothetical protein